MDGLCWEDHESDAIMDSNEGRYCKGIEDGGIVYWFPTLMKVNKESDKNEDIDQLIKM